MLSLLLLLLLQRRQRVVFVSRPLVTGGFQAEIAGRGGGATATAGNHQHQNGRYDSHGRQGCGRKCRRRLMNPVGRARVALIRSERSSSVVVVVARSSSSSGNSGGGGRPVRADVSFAPIETV